MPERIGRIDTRYSSFCHYLPAFFVAIMVMVSALGNMSLSTPIVLFLDGGYITVGAYTLIGPCVQIYTPQHPFDYLERRVEQEYAYPVTIGEDCWIGGGAVICPGVTIGDRCIIGAGSVVTKDIPSDCVAVGNPAKVIRKNDIKSDEANCLKFNSS